MQIKTTIGEFQIISNYLMPYLHMWKKTEMNNVRGLTDDDDLYLSAKLHHKLIKELITILDKDYFDTADTNIKFKITEALAIIFFRALKNRSASSEDIYFSTIRNEWMGKLYQVIIK
jgi:hypothetical protein